MTHTYTVDGLAPFLVTDHENDIASDVAVGLIVDLGGNALVHGDSQQTLIQMGVVAGLRAYLQYGDREIPA